MRARRVRFVARGEVAVEDFEIGAPAADQILIETLYSAISPGTERAFLEAAPGTGTAARGFPFQPGYSNIARVAAVGADVTRFRVGQIVASLQAHVSHALMPETIGPGRPPEKYREQFRSPITADGTFAPLHYLWPTPEGLDASAMKQCAAFNIASVGITGARFAKIELGEGVVVLGLGPVGLIAAWAAKASGGFTVVGVDPAPSRRALAARYGLDAVVASIDAVPFKPRVVIEATGKPAPIPQAFKLCAPGGRVVLLGSTRGNVEGVDFYNDVHRKGLEIIGAQVLTRPIMDSAPGRWTAWDENALVLRLVAEKRLDLSPFVAAAFPAAQAAQAYKLIQDAPDTPGVLLDWTKNK
jgi:threonine dehydrogenase-like Zn-dependent dehydrogenase